MIKIENLQKNFGKETVLRNICLSINKGERVAIFGDNGSGKTTLIRCIMGIYRYKGKIEIFDEDARTKRNKIAAKTGYTPQIPPPISMSVSQLIDFIFDISGKRNKMSYDLLEQLGFDKNSINRSFRKLSGGMQKKVLIAIALGRMPELLILDEPVAYIDPDSRKTMAAIINELGKNITILYTSHASFKTPEILPTRIIEMDNGKIVTDEKYVKCVGGINE